jgi:transcriptional regulator with XRE-family HTH domain
MDSSIPIVQTHTTNVAVLGVVISLLREEKKIKQGEFAKQINMSSPSVSKIEQGTNTITYDTLLQIAKALNSKVSEVLQITEALCDLLVARGIQVFDTDKESQENAKQNKQNTTIQLHMSGKILKNLVKNSDKLYQKARNIQ